MRITLVSVYIFNFLITVIASWSKEDLEIFRLRHEVEVSEGLGVNFYDFLDIKPSANQDEINKAYRKKSRILHPDKVKQQFITVQSTKRKPTKVEIGAAAKDASDRFARLGIVTNILRGPGRERYDHFLNNGFPKWKGTGYYYARFRPGLRTVLIGLFIFIGGAGHWVALYLSWKRTRNFISRYIKSARHAAWGDNIPGLENLSGTVNHSGNELQAVNRRQRRLQDKDSKKEKKATPTRIIKTPNSAVSSETSRARKRVVAENGKVLIVDTMGNVFMEQVDENGETQDILLNPDELHKPNFRDTALYRLPLWVYSIITSQLPHKILPIREEPQETIEEVNSANNNVDEFELLDSGEKTADNGSVKTAGRKNKKKRK